VQRAEQEARARAQQAEQAGSAALQARKLAAISAVRVISNGFSGCERNSLYCIYSLNVEVTNGSKEALSNIMIGIATAPTDGAVCPSSYGTQRKLAVGFSPGEARDNNSRPFSGIFKTFSRALKRVEFARR
jgi:hypothetical protein